MPHPFGPPPPGSVHFAPSYIEAGVNADASQRTDPDSVNPLENADAEDFQSILENTQPRQDLPNATQQVRQSIRNRTLTAPGFNPGTETGPNTATDTRAVDSSAGGLLLLGLGILLLLDAQVGTS